VIELGAQGAQTGFDVPQALAVGQLREAHDQELFVGGKRAHPMIAAVTANALVEFVFGSSPSVGQTQFDFVHSGSVRLKREATLERSPLKMKSKKVTRSVSGRSIE